MRKVGIFQIMEPRNLQKADLETSVTFESLGIFLCGFHCWSFCACVFIYTGVFLTRNLFIIAYQLTKFQTPSSNLTRLKCPLQRAITQEKLDRICSKVNQVICSRYPISWPSFKLLAQILFEISCWQVKMPKFSKGHNSRNIWQIFFSKFNQIIYLSSPISWPSFKLLAQTVFEISCWQV